MAALLCSVVALGTSDLPVQRHVARWDRPPKHTPSTMVCACVPRQPTHFTKLCALTLCMDIQSHGASLTSDTGTSSKLVPESVPIQPFVWRHSISSPLLHMDPFMHPLAPMHTGSGCSQLPHACPQTDTGSRHTIHRSMQCSLLGIQCRT
jgi:hypothetical protein